MKIDPFPALNANPIGATQEGLIHYATMGGGKPTHSIFDSVQTKYRSHHAGTGGDKPLRSIVDKIPHNFIKIIKIKKSYKL